MMWTYLFVSATAWTLTYGEGILMVAPCQSVKGGGRCVSSPESCKVVGGSIVNALPETPCGSKEVCCFIVPTVPDGDQSCAACASLGRDALRDDDVTTPPPPRTTPRTTTTTTTTAAPSAPDVALPSATDDNMNLIRALEAVPSVRADSPGLMAAPAQPAVNQVRFFARSAELGFGVPYRIERTIFDKDAIKNTYCWQVALVDSSGKVFGGGALISKNYVLTAAHKVANRLPQNFQVVLGKYDFKDQEEDSRIASPLEVIVHENWDPVSFENNIALIRIPNVKCSTGNICTVCPSTKAMDPVAQAQDICFVTGWGSTYTKNDLARLQQDQVRPIKNDECLGGLERSNIREFLVPQSMFCGSSNDPDRLACDGDGGGPLVCMQSGTWQWELRGLVALGVSQCTNVTDAPTVYVDVGKLSGWIARTIQKVSTEKLPPPFTLKTNFAAAVPTTSTTQTTTASPETTTRPMAPPTRAPPAKQDRLPPALRRRTNENAMSFSYVFPSFLRHLDDGSVETQAL